MTAKEPMPILGDDIREASASRSKTASREAVGDHGTNPAIPLAVDLEGTLLPSDLLTELLLILAKTRPLKLLRMPFWLLHGLAAFKERIAMEAIPDVATLPYDRTVLAYLDEQKRQGRPLVLATGADQAVARKIAQQLDRFDTVLASDGRVNLRGQAKRDRLVAEFGVGGFDYVGTRNSDRIVWRAGHNTILVHPGERLTKVKEKGATGRGGLRARWQKGRGLCARLPGETLVEEPPGVSAVDRGTSFLRTRFAGKHFSGVRRILPVRFGPLSA